MQFVFSKALEVKIECLVIFIVLFSVLLGVILHSCFFLALLQ